MKMSQMWYDILLSLRQEDTIIRKVELTMDEQKKYEVIKKLVDENGNKSRAALTLGLTPRHINRLVKAYKEKGKAPSYMVTEGASLQQLSRMTYGPISSICINPSTMMQTLCILQSSWKFMNRLKYP